MLEKILKGISVMTFVSLTHCAIDDAVNRSFADDRYSFYRKKVVLTEDYGEEIKTQKTKYVYDNDIEVEVNYKKIGKIKDFMLTVKKDPHNLLIKNTPKNDSAVGLTYYIFFNHSPLKDPLDTPPIKYFRQINFRYDGNNIGLTIFANLDLKYSCNGREGEIPKVFRSRIFDKLQEVDMELHIPDQITVLDQL